MIDAAYAWNSSHEIFKIGEFLCLHVTLSVYKMSRNLPKMEVAFRLLLPPIYDCPKIFFDVLQEETLFFL